MLAKLFRLLLLILGACMVIYLFSKYFPDTYYTVRGYVIDTWYEIRDFIKTIVRKFVH